MASNNVPNSKGIKSHKNKNRGKLQHLTRPQTFVLAAQCIHFDERVQAPYLGTTKTNCRILMSSYSLTMTLYDFSVLKVFSFVQQSFNNHGSEECETLTPGTEYQIVPSVRIRPQHTPPNILTVISCGEFSMAPIQYLHGNPLNSVSERDAQNFAFDGWSQFWNATFGMLLNWVFDFNDLIPLIGGPNDLPPVLNFDPSTWTIPSIIRYGLLVPELVNWHNLPNANEDWSLISDSSEEDSEDLNVHSLLPPLEHVGSPIEPENPQPSEPSTSNLAPSTSFGPPPALPLGRGAQLLQWLQQMQQTTQPASGPISPLVSYGRGRDSFQPSIANWPPSGYFDQDPDGSFSDNEDDWDWHAFSS